jgi:diguanylate cyclase (GGDEF)-like protein
MRRNNVRLRIASRMTKACALLFLDLDGLKRINDRFGHEAGDAAIREFAGVLRKSFRDSDVLSRLGGDEFVVFVTAIGEEIGTAVARFEDNPALYNRAHPNEAAISASMARSTSFRAAMTRWMRCSRAPTR